MAFDTHKNFAVAPNGVSVAPSPASSGTTLSVSNTDAANFPDPTGGGNTAYNCTVCPAGVAPDPSNAEIVRVTAKGASDSGGAGNTQLTITRAQEGSSARTVLVGDQIAMTETSKVFTDIETAIPIAAVKSDQTTASSTSVYVSPGTQQYHPSAVKAWVEYKRSTATIGASYNISSVTDGGTGTATINFSVAMTSATYGISAVGGFQSGTTENGTVAIDTDTGLTTGHFIATTHGGASSRVDLGQMFLSVFGTQ